MQTIDRFGVPPTLRAEIEYRMDRLAGEAYGGRRAVGHQAVRQHVGHVLIALGRAIHGGEPASRAEGLSAAR